MKNLNKKTGCVSAIIILLLFSGTFISAQKLNIPNSSYFIINSSTSVVVQGDVNLGGGASGVLDAGGDLLKITGTLYANKDANFKIQDGTINISTTNYNAESVVKYSGNNQEVLNYNYGNLIFEGTGMMSILGDASTPTTCNNLTIQNTGNSVKIPENKAITVNGNIINNAGNAGIVVASSSSGDGSLIFSTSNIDGTVKRYFSGTRWHYITTPISDMATSNFNSNNFLTWDPTLEWGGLGDWAPWGSYTENDLTVGQGYAYYYYEDTISFEGKMNVSNYTKTLHTSATGTNANQGWNLIGNPYTSAIDWDAAVLDGAVPAGAENAIYFFDDDDASGQQSNYKYYVPSTGGTYGVGTSSATKNIPIGQGFFVKTNTDNVTLNLKSSYRLHNTQEFYKSKQNNILNLQVNGNNKTDETILRIVSNSTLFFDGRYDARKLFTTNTDYPQIYSISPDQQDYVAINSIPEINEKRIIPLGFKAIQGTYTFSLTNFDIQADYMYLMDTYNNQRTDLTEDFLYEFEHEGGIVNDRFYIFYCNIEDDHTAPVPDLQSLPDIYATCSATPQIPTATDECAGVITAYTETTFPIVKYGTTTITWVYEDDNHNITTQEQKVIISDNEKPKINCPENQEVYADITNTYTVIGNEFDLISYYDNCEVKSIKNNINNENTLEGELFKLGKTMISWTAIDKAGNYITDEFVVTVNKQATGISSNNNKIEVFPNPVSDFVVVSGINKNTKIIITNVTGEIIYSKNSMDIIEKINFRNYSAGIYFVKLENNSTSISYKIVKN